MLGPKERVTLGKKLTAKRYRIEDHIGMSGAGIQIVDIGCRC
jgi:hypothetical protein